MKRIISKLTANTKIGKKHNINHNHLIIITYHTISFNTFNTIQYHNIIIEFHTQITILHLF